MAGMSIIVRTIARLLFPFIFLFGAYVVAHGHLTSGGGFPGGVIIAASVVMLILANGTEWIQKRVGLNHAKAMMSAGLLAIFVIGVLGLLLGSFFLQNVLPAGELVELFSGGNLPLLYLAAGIEVAAAIFLVFYAMLSFRGDEE